MSWKTKYCEALALVPYAIDKDLDEVNLCEETLCKDCVFSDLDHCSAVIRAIYYEEHFDELFVKKVNRRRPALGVSWEYIGGCGSEMDCCECLFKKNEHKDCMDAARYFIWERIKNEEHR